MLGSVRARHVACLVSCLLLGLLLAACYLSREYVGSLLPRVTVSVDLSVLAALLVGAAGSLSINFLLQRNFALIPVSAATAPAAAAAAGAAGAGVGGTGEGAGAEAGAAGGEVGDPGPGLVAFDIPDNACYFCVRRPATSKCGSCRLVYYCCRLSSGAHTAHAGAADPLAVARAGRVRDAVRALLPPHLLVPTQPDLVAAALLKMAAYVRQRPHLVTQPMADAVWGAALSMRGEGLAPRLHMAWAWGFLEASVESGGVDAFLGALRIDAHGAADLPREVGAFFRHAPRQQLLYF
ncbi:hypothetical protein CLOP_g19743 [Closterium sp. NIES-67]|nr:hypothetical protein CLOP_g19743 [Closterium sp. NIES-67]